MEESSKSPTNDLIAGGLPEFLEESDWDGELSPEFPIKEEMIEEVMQELYKEITCSKPSITTNSDTASPSENIPSPSLSPSHSPLSAPLVVGNGKSESCGASVSDTASTVMAGVEYVGVAGNLAGGNVGLAESGARVGEKGGDCKEGHVGERMMDGCDGVEFGDEWLERVMGWGPLELEGWG